MKYDIVILSLPEMNKTQPAAGPAYLKSFLEENGKTVKVIDGNRLDDFYKIILEVDRYEFDWLGISVFSYEQKEFALKIGKEFDNVVYGGSGVHLDWPEKPFIVGEGEYSLLEFLNGNLIYPGINGLPPVQIQNISELPIPDYSDNLESFDYSSLYITGSRGCVRKCTFCDVGLLWPKYRWVDGEVLGKQVIELSKKHKINNVAFSDSLVNGSMSHFRKMVDVLSESDHSVKWGGQFIVRNQKDFAPEYFKKLKQAGCKQLTIGIESGSESVRWHMKKKFSNNDIDYYMKHLIENDIGVKMLLIVGYPTETEHDFRETLNMLDKYKDYAKTGNIHLSPHMMLVDKNVPLDTHHRELFDVYGFDWKNENSDYDIRYERFLKIYEYEKYGYLFNEHAKAKIKKFEAH